MKQNNNNNNDNSSDNYRAGRGKAKTITSDDLGSIGARRWRKTSPVETTNGNPFDAYAAASYLQTHTHTHTILTICKYRTRYCGVRENIYSTFVPSITIRTGGRFTLCDIRSQCRPWLIANRIFFWPHACPTCVCVRFRRADNLSAGHCFNC